jgi:hypothetical protein
MSAEKFGGLLSLFQRGRAVVPAAAANMPVPWVPPAAAPAVDYSAAVTGRLVFAFDATASRAHAWKASKRLQDDLLSALPGKLQVALAVHSGGQVERFTRFTNNPAKLRDMAAGVECRGGYTQLLPILKRVAGMDRVGVVLYIGDSFEESKKLACQIADELRARETRVIILHEGRPPATFGMIADLTAGALLPFDISALDQLGELLQAVAVLAVGDVEALQTAQATMPAATLLLEHLSDRKLIGRRTT